MNQKTKKGFSVQLVISVLDENKLIILSSSLESRGQTRFISHV